MIPIICRRFRGDGRNITIETGRLKQADGSVVVRIGKTVILGTVVSCKKSKSSRFLPLTVDYQFAAAGRFPGGFFKREARPSDKRSNNAFSGSFCVHFPVITMLKFR
jgi:polyribonucleotide nucleotidyltransferase